ncbi:GSCOCG00002858001-RA-CDS [Cotesia congregata]|nr:GSCOCG00002858001-RA-CDS [Cotesia congregata]
MTLGEMWDSGKRLIISYDYSVRSKSSMRSGYRFWDPIVQEWGNVNSPEKLKEFIDKHESYSKNAAKLWDDDPLIFRAMMAAVTLDMTSIVTDSVAHFFGQGSYSLREIGTQVGPLVTEWYNENYCSSANIVTVDFIDATGIVPVAIYWNKIRGERNYAKKINSSNI